ncbi:MAG: hypothetical protein IKJ97_08285 [Bacteroidaceae bacterium]|nr:hypothetical protein [Bacteroidaceae bacterium]
MEIKDSIAKVIHFGADVAIGAEGYFFEVHPEPEKALCDSACMLRLDKLEGIVKKLVDNK